MPECAVSPCPTSTPGIMIFPKQLGFVHRSRKSPPNCWIPWRKSQPKRFRLPMVAYLNRYYALGLVLALLAPLWFFTVTSQAASASSLHDALIWTAVLLGCWLLITKRRGFAVRGAWRKPTKDEANLYLRLLIGVLLVDFGSKAFFFRWDRPDKIELFKNFGLHSVFHVTAFEPFHLVLLLYFFYVFLLGELCLDSRRPVCARRIHACYHCLGVLFNSASRAGSRCRLTKYTSSTLSCSHKRRDIG